MQDNKYYGLIYKDKFWIFDNYKDMTKKAYELDPKKYLKSKDLKFKSFVKKEEAVSWCEYFAKYSASKTADKKVVIRPSDESLLSKDIMTIVYDLHKRMSSKKYDNSILVIKKSKNNSLNTTMYKVYQQLNQVFGLSVPYSLKDDVPKDLKKFFDFLKDKRKKGLLEYDLK